MYIYYRFSSLLSTTYRKDNDIAERSMEHKNTIKNLMDLPLLINVKIKVWKVARHVDSNTVIISPVIHRRANKSVPCYTMW